MTHKHKIDAVWELYTTISGWICCYDIFTKAWNYRGWKTYSKQKQILILSWGCEITQELDWEDIKTTLLAWSNIFTLNPEVPHIFYFSEDTRMLEWFDEDTSKHNFERYREWKK